MIPSPALCLSCPLCALAPLRETIPPSGNGSFRPQNRAEKPLAGIAGTITMPAISCIIRQFGQNIAVKPRAGQGSPVHRIRQAVSHVPPAVPPSRTGPRSERLRSSPAAGIFPRHTRRQAAPLKRSGRDEHAVSPPASFRLAARSSFSFLASGPAAHGREAGNARDASFVPRPLVWPRLHLPCAAGLPAFTQAQPTWVRIETLRYLPNAQRNERRTLPMKHR